MDYISKAFSVSKTDNGAYVLEYGDFDYGRRLKNYAAFEDVDRAKKWLHGAIDASFDILESPKQAPEPNAPCVVGNG